MMKILWYMNFMNYEFHELMNVKGWLFNKYDVLRRVIDGTRHEVRRVIISTKGYVWIWCSSVSYWWDPTWGWVSYHQYRRICNNMMFFDELLMVPNMRLGELSSVPKDIKEGYIISIRNESGRVIDNLEKCEILKCHMK